MSEAETTGRVARRGPKALAALSLLAGAVLLVNANVLGARFYERWDVTREQLYTLSPATTKILADLGAEVSVTVLLSRGDPSLPGVRHTLTAYREQTNKLQIKYLDPEQNPAAFLSTQQKYGLIAGRAEDGRVVTDAALIVAQGERHWFITNEEMLGFDAESASVKSRLEQALTQAIVNVLGVEKAKVCFSRGHQELAVNDAGPEGLVELRDRIQKSNYEVEERDLPSTDKNGAFAGCRLLIVAGPALPFDAADAAQMREAIERGMSALLLLAPVLGEGGSIKSSGLESVTALAEVELERNLVIETDSSARLPRGLGEVFFATPKPHAVSAGLLKGGAKLELRVLVSGAQSLRLSGTRAKPLLETSEHALAFTDIRALTDGRLERAPESAHQKRLLGVAHELSRKDAAAPVRLVVLGARNPADNRSFRDSGLYGDRMLMENAVSWLSARPALVSVPEKAARPVGLALSEDGLGEVLRYVLIYMPGSAALIGLLVVLRRRTAETRSRKAAKEPRGNDEART